MSISILISIVSWNSLAPVRSAFEVNVVDVGPGINNVDIDTLARIGSVKVLIEIAEA